MLVVTALNASAADQRAVADLLKPLNLSGYPSVMRPPDFSGRTADGETVSLTNLRGRVGVLNFWATWCQDCRQEMPVFERLHREFVARGLSVVGINVREGTATVRDYSKELGLTFPLVLDPQGKIYAAYGVIGLPTTFLIGRDGRAVALAVGPREWESTSARALIQMLLTQPAALKEMQ
jgi:peroxiredoxin